MKQYNKLPNKYLNETETSLIIALPEYCENDSLIIFINWWQEREDDDHDFLLHSDLTRWLSTIANASSYNTSDDF